jgi:hypothetical protein
MRRDDFHMVTHVAYDAVQCRTTSECIEAIRAHIELGWRVSQIRGPKEGPFYLVFRKDAEGE